MDKKIKPPKDPKLIQELSNCDYNWLWKCRFPSQFGRTCNSKCKHYSNERK